ncbi:hypothetical protein OYC64_016245 [Pagothenia borchgrevinki]|uniref:Uncharacterized protein n=1 Tax=Pagothenia borchgrevinki TaxID=8213 RepID=A0ABD2HKA6_PAGBO
MTLGLALEDVEALYLGPSFLTADPMGPLLDDEDEEALSPSCSLEGKAPASPPLSFSFSSSSSPPPPSHASLFLGTKASEDPPPLAAPRPDRSRALQRRCVRWHGLDVGEN